ncbi:sensor domain-containing diguanylate cyclase [Mycobacterium sp. 236(2023)]|uniref:sensor domain-containing diguanylate cyclase n=1 Tax=Mycobacterium sp. 236(2023) TaxID=3038163 RepID=UPI002415412C|nr:sensor domain-containing diguanylate cyclase [Mycobacterium sp. 236(2023)]MDG4664577.1 sensor domain-containing diguanylate cyclase [Mycobacterium sp. 236(2023)]
MIAEAEYRRFLDRSLVPVVIHDGRSVQYANPAATRALGTEFVGRPIDDVVAGTSGAIVRESLATLQADEDVLPTCELSLRCGDGSVLTVRAQTTLRIRDEVRTYELTFTEIVNATDIAEQRMRAVLDLLHVGVVIMGHHGRFEFTNKAAREILHSGADALVGMHHSSRGVDLLMYDAHGEPITAKSHPLRRIVATGQDVGGQVVGVDRLDDSRVWVTGHGCLMDPDNPQTSRVLLSFTDITEHHAARKQLLHDATHDWLTGLPNRGHALDKAAAMLADTGAGRLSAVLFIDLDRLKVINDSYGHPIGDDVLRNVAHRMRSVARPQDLVARMGGDEFVFLLLGPIADTELEAMASRLHDALGEDIVLGPLTLLIGASIGITTVTADDSRNIAEVFRDADAAMYQAKARGRAKTARFEEGPAG